MNNQLQPTYNPQIGQPQPQNQLPNGQSSAATANNLIRLPAAQ